MHEHGGQLNEAARNYGIPVAQWIDLSTGINPRSYPVQLMPPTVWHRLPEEDDDLQKAAASYYENDYFIPVPGSQAAIKLIPRLRQKGEVGILNPTYSEHAKAWLEAGHKVTFIDVQTREQTANKISALINSLDVLVISNPNNPCGLEFSKNQLIEWQQTLLKRGGWLIVDEAFRDADPENSLIDLSGTPGLIVMRSLGKFFGLAGARVGFVFAAKELLERMRLEMGPWTISGPSRFVAARALEDKEWQKKTRFDLLSATKRLATLLTDYKMPVAGSTAYFQWIRHSGSNKIYRFFAEQGILLRLFQEPLGLRIGLPGKQEEWSRLEKALSALHSQGLEDCSGF